MSALTIPARRTQFGYTLVIYLRAISVQNVRQLTNIQYPPVSAII